MVNKTTENMIRPLRILCVMSTLDRGGAESMCMNLYRHIDREIVQFDFVKHTPDKGAFEDEILSLGGRIFAAPRYKIYNHLSYTQWWNHFLREHPEYTIIHGHFFTISSVFFRAAHKAGRITVGHSHCTKSPKEGTSRRLVNCLGNLLIDRIEENSDYCLACSQMAGEWVFPHKFFHVLNNAIDCKRFVADPEVARAVREEFSLGDCLVLGNVSRFNLQKNPHGTLEIFRLVHEKRPDSKLLWVGDGPMRAEVQEKAKELGLQDDVVFAGVRSDVERLLQAMDAFVFPSFYEGLGIAAVEAQAAGVRTFCSDTIPREVAVTSLCQFLSLNSLSEWANKICKISEVSPHSNMSEAIIEAGFDIHSTARWLQDFYLEIDSKH